MKVTRRTFVKGSAAAGGLLAASKVFDGGLLTLSAKEPAQSVTEEWVPTTCWIGKQDCGMLARKVNGRVIKFEGHGANPRNQGTLCPKGIAQIGAIYDPNRVKTPLVREAGSAKGEPGKFRQASWNEALKLVADAMNEVRERDPRLLIWQKGRSKAKNFYDTAFVKATGATKLHHGAYCSDAGYRACEYTIGCHGVLHPDFRYTKYLLSWGWNITGAGGNKTCWLTWNQQLGAARERGLKVINIDPRIRGAGHQVDKWLPVRPSSDLYLALTWCNLLIQQDTIDRPYLKAYSNSPHLVKGDGYFLRVDDKVQVWDEVTNSAQPHDGEGVEPALEGSYEVGGETVRTAFQVFKEHVAAYTPARAADICGISADDIIEVAREMGQEALIGSSIVIDGVEVPHRPVAIMSYHVVQQELGFQFNRAQLQLMMLLGAVGAAGGQQIDYTWKIHKNYEGLDNISITEEPNIYLNKSKFYPINSNNSSVVAKAMLDPNKYGVDYTPEVVIVHHANPLTSFGSAPDVTESYHKFKFVAVIDPYLSKTADLFADVVLPAATIEKYEGPMSATDQYTDAVAMRIPPMDPMFEFRGDIDIYLDLCEEAGLLTGEDGYIDQINKAFKFDEDLALPLDRKPEVRDIFDRWARSQGIDEGIAYFEQNGIKVKGPVSPTKRYGYMSDPVFGGALHRLYGESLLRLQDEMKAMDVGAMYHQDYTALPTWRTPTMEDSKSSGFDLYLITYKLIEFKQSRASHIALLAELAPEQRLDINPKTAEERGIEDGDEVVVESHNAVDGTRRQVTIKAHLTESLRPDVVGMPHHYGEIAKTPAAKGQGPSANELTFTGDGYTTNTADQSFQVMVKVSKA